MTHGKGDNPNWYAETGEWVQSLDRRLRERPTYQGERTDQDRYWDSGPYAEGDTPWLDNYDDDREAEL